MTEVTKVKLIVLLMNTINSLSLLGILILFIIGSFKILRRDTESSSINYDQYSDLSVFSLDSEFDVKYESISRLLKDDKNLELDILIEKETIAEEIYKFIILDTKNMASTGLEIFQGNLQSLKKGLQNLFKIEDENVEQIVLDCYKRNFGDNNILSVDDENFIFNKFFAWLFFSKKRVESFLFVLSFVDKDSQIKYFNLLNKICFDLGIKNNFLEMVTNPSESELSIFLEFIQKSFVEKLCRKYDTLRGTNSKLSNTFNNEQIENLEINLTENIENIENINIKTVACELFGCDHNELGDVISFYSDKKQFEHILFNKKNNPLINFVKGILEEDFSYLKNGLTQISIRFPERKTLIQKMFDKYFTNDNLDKHISISNEESIILEYVVYLFFNCKLTERLGMVFTALNFMEQNNGYLQKIIDICNVLHHRDEKFSALKYQSWDVCLFPWNVDRKRMWLTIQKELKL